ncbi:MAG: Rpn family recombination-promoting nuclease/putative transposase [Desulfovibrio sp.]|nr:Rpn family recombination-promoting nuclease/putative transposase [Desulfovibrio sp.]
MCTKDTPAPDVRGGEKIYDSLYKLLFSHKVAIEDLLRYFVSATILGSVDFHSLERCPDSFINRKRAERREDLIWRVRSMQENWVYVYILNEFQSSVDPWMPVRMAEYVTVFHHDLVRNGVVTIGQKLPPVLPVVIYNGASTWTAPTSLGQLQYPVSERLGMYQPQQAYFLIDIGRLGSELVENKECILSKFFSLERARSPEEIVKTVRDVVRYLKGQHFQEINDIFCQWVLHVGMRRFGCPHAVIPKVIDLEEVGNMFEENIRQWQENFLATYKKEIMEKVWNEAKDKVRQEVWNEAKDKVRQEVDKDASMRIAKKLRAMQLSEAQIIEATGLSFDEVRDVLSGPKPE